MQATQPTLQLQRVSEALPPLNTRLIIWTVWQNNAVGAHWAKAVPANTVQTKNLDLEQENVIKDYVWVVNGVPIEMFSTDLWSLQTIH